MKSTTILCVRHKNRVALAGDGQVTFQNTVMKHTAKKVRKLYQDKCLAGFAGATADSFTLFERFEKKLEQFHGNIVEGIRRACQGLEDRQDIATPGGLAARC